MLSSPLLPDFGRKFRPKMAHPKPNGLMTNINPALMQNVLDLAKTEWISMSYITAKRMIPDDVLNYLNGCSADM